MNNRMDLDNNNIEVRNEHSKMLASEKYVDHIIWKDKLFIKVGAVGGAFAVGFGGSALIEVFKTTGKIFGLF